MITHWFWEPQPAGCNPLSTTTARHCNDESTPQLLSQVSTGKWIATHICVRYTPYAFLTLSRGCSKPSCDASRPHAPGCAVGVHVKLLQLC